MTASRPLFALVSALVAAAAFAGSAKAQSVPFSPSGTLQPQMPPDGMPAWSDAQGTTAPAHHGRLRALDLNGDHLLSRAEIGSRKHLARKFDDIDTNRDGELSREELRAWRSAHRGARNGGATG
jgi:hypothetical protein